MRRVSRVIGSPFLPPVAIGLAHQKLGISSSIIGEEVVKIIVAARERATVCEDITRQLTECTIICQKRHATSRKKSLQHPRPAQDCMSHLAERMIVLIR